MSIEYLTLEQVCEALGKTAEDVRAMVADGRLSEVSEGGQAFFKKADVDQIAAKEGSSIVDLALTDEADAQETESFASALASLSDSGSDLGVLEQSPPPAAEAPSGAEAQPPVAEALELSPAEINLESIPEELPAAPAAIELGSDFDISPVGDVTESAAKEDAAVPDLGLSGSSILGLAPEGEAPVPPAKEPSKPAKVGISVFDDDELPLAADPMGETQISAGVPELEAVGSGSGLLDLTQESDDTSLGADLLDVISPAEETETEAAAEPVEIVEAAETIEDSGEGEMTVAEPADDALAPAHAAFAAAPRTAAAATMRGAVPINVCLGIGLLGMAVAGLATAGQIQGVWPDPLTIISRDVVHYAVFGGLALIALVTGVLGILADRAK